MGTSPLYFDNNATAPLRAEASAAMHKAMGAPANPSSVHSFGRSARLTVEAARESVALLAGSRAADVVFTSGGTESNNLALAGFDHVVMSAIEHDSVRASALNASIINVTPDGIIDLDHARDVLAGLPDEQRPKTILSVMAANNETGVIQPLAELAALAHENNIAVHSDMVQLLGKDHFNFAALDLDYASLSAHKIGGPTGVGALLVKPGNALTSLLRGGGQEQGRRSGTENFIGIAGFGAAATAAFGDVAHYDAMSKWRNQFENVMRKTVSGAHVFGHQALRLGNTSCLAIAGKSAETMVMALDIAGVAISAGSACSSGKVKSSHVLAAMKAGDLAGQAVRISGGWQTKQTDFERLADVFLELYKR
ncbi:cysteine desulfurase family protein [Candidatus Puniceispirillum sp.]|jgi:cysteine desulfurase|uniref:cysteine desulfurase family protein n=1 Tax=Candidatus Puniceispirillum sp. TaxID=2026719 RepID=UPI001EB9C1A6|nr:cysteine desulfurase [Candidatus Puniceispirillum sp.]MBT6566427.1 cysteine desulfurase [Candidatus Puniceispirillum sp.]